MATVTKTFTENTSSSNRATWTVNVTCSNQIVSGNFSITKPVVTAKYVASNKGYVDVHVGFDIVIGNNYSASFLPYYNAGMPDYVTKFEAQPLSSGTLKTLPDMPDSANLNVVLSNAFNRDNKYEKTLSVKLVSGDYGISLMSGNATWTTGNEYHNTSDVVWNDVATITLDAPPTVELGTPAYTVPYAGNGVYSVPFTNANAKYGGDIQTITLTVGSDSTTKNYSSATVASDSISVTPTVAGTYTPVLTVTDTRGQTYSPPLEPITVNPYLVPSVSYDVYRTNANGVKEDEGHYALLQANISYTDAIATLTEPSIQIDGIDLDDCIGASVTWYSTYSNTDGVDDVISDWSTLVPQNHIVTIYGLVDWSFSTTGKFAEDTSYQFTLVANDSLGGHSDAITQTMSTAFYTIDFQAGGKEIAFGAPANDDISDFNGKDYTDDGLFKCEMGTAFNDMTAQEVSDFVDELDFIGTLAVDFIVEQGTSNYWTYRKWNSGVAECWCTYSVGSVAITTASTAYGGYRSAEQSLSFPSGLFVEAPTLNATKANAQGGWLANCSRNASNIYWYYGAGASITITGQSVAFYAIGKWK